MTSLKTWRRLLKETLKEWQARDVSLLASALAYSTVFSIAPLMILIIMIAGAVFNETVAEEQIVQQMTDAVGRDAAQLMATAIANLRIQPNNGVFQVILNLALLAFGASNVFAQIQEALNRIWEVKPLSQRYVFHFIRKRLLSFAMIATVSFLLLVTAIGSIILTKIFSLLNQSLPQISSVWQILLWLASFAMVSTVFAAIYTILPDAEIHWRTTFIGAMITALLFLGGQSVFGAFLHLTNIGSAYGVAGSFLIVITWIYYAAQILFLGAVFTKVFARHRRVPISPSRFAISTTDLDDED